MQKTIFLSTMIVALTLALNAQAQTAPDDDELTKLLKEFREPSANRYDIL
jgi:hypothetical protein